MGRNLYQIIFRLYPVPSCIAFSFLFFSSCICVFLNGYWGRTFSLRLYVCASCAGLIPIELRVCILRFGDCGVMCAECCRLCAICFAAEMVMPSIVVDLVRDEVTKRGTYDDKVIHDDGQKDDGVEPCGRRRRGHAP